MFEKQMSSYHLAALMLSDVDVGDWHDCSAQSLSQQLLLV